MKVLLLALVILTVLLLTGCPVKDDPIIDAKYLVLNNCHYTGQAFDSVEHQWIQQGRSGFFKDVTQTYYIYVCDNNAKQLSLLKLKVEKVE